jgi:hypothetical protein
VIVCDDGSTDDTKTVLDAYQGRITHLQKEHGGVASARNVALNVARGEFFAVLDADDAYFPERLEALAELAAAYPSLDMLCTDAFFEVDGRVVGRFAESCSFEVVDQRAAVLDRCFCAWPAVRRTALARVGGFDESLRTGSDWECAIRLIHSGATAGLVAEPLYRYRIRTESLTADRVATLSDRVHFLERVASDERLTREERNTVGRSLAAQRRSLLLTQAEASLRAGGGDARRRAFALACSRSVGPRVRAAGLMAAIAPTLAGRFLDQRSSARRSRLDRSYPRGE